MVQMADSTLTRNNSKNVTATDLTQVGKVREYTGKNDTVYHFYFAAGALHVLERNTGESAVELLGRFGAFYMEFKDAFAPSEEKTEEKTDTPKKSLNANAMIQAALTGGKHLRWTDVINLTWACMEGVRLKLEHENRNITSPTEMSVVYNLYDDEGVANVITNVLDAIMGSGLLDLGDDVEVKDVEISLDNDEEKDPAGNVKAELTGSD